MKNWTVISKPVKEQYNGLCRYLAYLTSESNVNHQGKTDIFPIVGNVLKLQKNINNQVIQRDFERAKARKGGRSIASYAQSFVFTLPKAIEPNPTLDDWKNIAKELIKTIAKFSTDGDLGKLKNHIFINLHDQENPHLNIVVSKVIDGQVIKSLQQKSIVNALKKTFNYAVLDQLGLSPSDYTPETKRSKRYTSDYFDKNKDFIIRSSVNPDALLQNRQIATQSKRRSKYEL